MRQFYRQPRWERHGRGGVPWNLLPGGVRPAQQQNLLAVALYYLTRWMVAFPTVEDLAAASLDGMRL